MSRQVRIDFQMPDDWSRLHLPAGIQHRLQQLLNRQDEGVALTDDERTEAEGIVQVAELLSLLRLRAERAMS